MISPFWDDTRTIDKKKDQDQLSRQQQRRQLRNGNRKEEDTNEISFDRGCAMFGAVQHHPLLSRDSLIYQDMNVQLAQ